MTLRPVSNGHVRGGRDVNAVNGAVDRRYGAARVRTGEDVADGGAVIPPTNRVGGDEWPVHDSVPSSGRSTSGRK